MYFIQIHSLPQLEIVLWLAPLSLLQTYDHNHVTPAEEL